MGSWVAEIAPPSDAASSVAAGSTERFTSASAIGPSSRSLATEVMRPAAIANLLGHEGGPGAPFDKALAVPGTHLFLYGKREARPGRKMGHLSAVGRTPEEALARVLEAKKQLQPGHGA